jgi:hypothetical protein
VTAPERGSGASGHPTRSPSPADDGDDGALDEERRGHEPSEKPA